MVKRLLYLIYRIEWKKYHPAKKGFKGCAPACYQEWQDHELQDMLEHPDWYSSAWCFDLIWYLSEKEKKKNGKR